jgi:hypothetical protein
MGRFRVTCHFRGRIDRFAVALSRCSADQRSYSPHHPPVIAKLLPALLGKMQFLEAPSCSYSSVDVRTYERDSTMEIDTNEAGRFLARGSDGKGYDVHQVDGPTRTEWFLSSGVALATDDGVTFTVPGDDLVLTRVGAQA